MGQEIKTMDKIKRNSEFVIMEWKKIPKDKDGFFDDESNMYDELPVIVSEHNKGMYPTLHYIDKDNWDDTLADLSRSRFKYYCKCNEINDL